MLRLRSNSACTARYRHYRPVKRWTLAAKACAAVTRLCLLSLVSFLPASPYLPIEQVERRSHHMKLDVHMHMRYRSHPEAPQKNSRQPGLTRQRQMHTDASPPACISSVLPDLGSSANLQIRPGASHLLSQTEETTEEPETNAQHPRKTFPMPCSLQAEDKPSGAY